MSAESFDEGTGFVVESARGVGEFEVFGGAEFVEVFDAELGLAQRPSGVTGGVPGDSASSETFGDG